jgi:hypothetical protein
VGAASLAASAANRRAAGQAAQATSKAGLVVPAGAALLSVAAVALAAPARSEAQVLRGAAVVGKGKMALTWVVGAGAGAVAGVPRGVAQCQGRLQAAAAAGVLRATATAAAEAEALVAAGRAAVARCMGWVLVCLLLGCRRDGLAGR